MKNLMLILLISIIFFPIISIAGGLYNIHSVGYTYGCNGQDGGGDSCGAGEITLKINRGGAARSGSYRCGKIDETKPIISVTGIQPAGSWVNILDYNPIKNLNITITDAGAGIRLVKVTIGQLVLTWDFGYSNKKSSFTITYSSLCSKAGYSVSNCRKKLLFEGKNTFKVEAWDAVYSYYDGSKAPNDSNYEFFLSSIWVDNSKSTYTIDGDKAFSVGGLINLYFDNKWKNRTLLMNLSVADKYGEGLGISVNTLTCSGKPENAIWIAPLGVDPNTGKFQSYNNIPSISDCKWDCSLGYVKVNNSCVNKYKVLSCKEYFLSKGYDLSTVDGDKLYFSLDGYPTSIINKVTGIYTGVYDENENDYLPTVDKCLLVPGEKIDYIIHEKDANGNTIVSTGQAPGVILNSNSILSVTSSILEKQCSSLGSLLDFEGGANNQGAGDKVVPIYWISKENFKIREDDDNDHLVDNVSEGSWLYWDIENSEYTTDITKACGQAVCVSNTIGNVEDGCKCKSGYFPINSNNTGIDRYDECVLVSTGECLVDSDTNGYLDTIKTLTTNQIVLLQNSSYSVDPIPVCGNVCSEGQAKDTNNDGWPDTCIIDGVCGEEKDTCEAGEYNDIADTDDYYKWECKGKNGGTTANCQLHKPIDGECGSGKDTCAKGLFEDISDSDTEYKWKCLGEYGGDDASCSLQKRSCGDDITITISGTTYTYTTKQMPDGNCWTSQNMRHPPKNLIKSWSDGNGYKTWWGYYNNDTSYANEGMLYTWRAAMGCENENCENENLLNSVCGQLGSGWHLPSDQELRNLETSLGCIGTSNEGWRCDGLGWLGNKLGGLFSYLPGIREYLKGKSDFVFHSTSLRWWSSTIYDNYNVWFRNLGDSSSKVARYNGYKSNAYSIICINNN